jgi:hypothetical protein
LIVVASVALRLVLTRDRLMTLVVPKIEERVGAQIAFGDIGIRFPFGFGVDIGDLTFDKQLPDGSQARFSAGTVTVRASLLSLIKRKPEIKAIDIRNADVKLTGTPNGIDVALEGMKSTISMKPAAQGFSIRERIGIDEFSLTRGGTTLPFGAITIDGDVEADEKLNSFNINSLDVRWADMLSAHITGNVQDLTRIPQFSITLRSDDIDIATLVDWIRTKPLGDLVPRLRNTPLQEELPVELGGGVVSIDLSASGTAKALGAIAPTGIISLKELSVGHGILKDEALVDGDIELAKQRIRMKNVVASFGDSRITIDSDIEMSEDGKPERISFESKSEIDLEDIEIEIGEGEGAVRGKVAVNAKGWGTPQTIAGLFPAAGKEVSPERIKESWKRFALEGAVRASEVDVSYRNQPLSVSSLSADAQLQHGDIKSFETDFRLNGSPYSCSGSMVGVLPALSELATIVEKAKRGEGPSSLGEALDEAHNAPDIKLTIKGTAFDARPFQASSKAKREGEQAKEPGTQQPAGRVPLTYNPVSALLMKNTWFFVRIDSIITEKAVFNGLYTKATIRDGRMRMNPLLLNYAEGMGRGSVRMDFRNMPDVKSDVIFSIRDINAGKALGSFSKHGTIVDGTFTLETNSGFSSGPDVNALMSMNATGSAVSTKGRIDISSLLAPLKGSAPLDLSPIEKFNFHEWTGNFMVVNGRLQTDDWKIKSSKANWLITGSYGFDGTLDFGIQLSIPPLVQNEMKDLRKYGDLVNLLKDGQGNLVLDFRLGGTAKSPKLSLDTSKAEARAGDKLINDFMNKAKDFLKK